MEGDPFSRASAKLLALLNEGDPQKLSMFIYRDTENQNQLSRQDAVELREELLSLLGPDPGTKEVETYLRNLTEKSPAGNPSPEYQETPPFDPLPQDRFSLDNPPPFATPPKTGYPLTVVPSPIERYPQPLPQPIAAPAIERHPYRPYTSPQRSEIPLPQPYAPPSQGKDLQGLRPYPPIHENHPQNSSSSYAFHRERTPQRPQPRFPDTERLQGVQSSRNHVLSEEILAQIDPNLQQKAHRIFKTYDIFSEGRLGAQDSFIALLELHVQSFSSTTRPDFEVFTRLFRCVAGRNESVSFRDFLYFLPLILR